MALAPTAAVAQGRPRRNSRTWRVDGLEAEAAFVSKGMPHTRMGTGAVNSDSSNTVHEPGLRTLAEYSPQERLQRYLHTTPTSMDRS